MAGCCPGALLMAQQPIVADAGIWRILHTTIREIISDTDYTAEAELLLRRKPAVRAEQSKFSVTYTDGISGTSFAGLMRAVEPLHPPFTGTRLQLNRTPAVRSPQR